MCMKGGHENGGDTIAGYTVVAPWLEVAIDLIGPWQVKIGTRVLLFQVLTCIDTVTNLAEVICIDNQSSVHISMFFRVIGWHGILAHHNVYTIMVESLLVQPFHT